MFGLSVILFMTPSGHSWIINKILSPERASERNGMSTVEQFIWVNLYSLDLTFVESKVKWVDAHINY